MNINLPSKVRQAIYIIATIATPVVFYLNQQTVINDFWSGLYAVVMTAVTGLAALNTDTSETY